MVRPIGSSSPQNVRAVAWLTIITAGAVAVSPSVKSRPRSSGMLQRLEESRADDRQSIGTAVSGGSTDVPGADHRRRRVVADAERNAARHAGARTPGSACSASTSSR